MNSFRSFADPDQHFERRRDADQERAAAGATDPGAYSAILQQWWRPTATTTAGRGRVSTTVLVQQAHATAVRRQAHVAAVLVLRVQSEKAAAGPGRSLAAGQAPRPRRLLAPPKGRRLKGLLSTDFCSVASSKTL